jgi:hypothetical protein
MVSFGIVVIATMTGWLILRYVQQEKKGEWPFYGVAGLVIIAAAEILLWRKEYFTGLYFTPIVWTGYILLVDASVARLTSRSRIRNSPGSFLWLVVWSIPLWLVFEAYNLHLKNWVYVNLVQDPFLRYLGYGWSFATIWPALFETTDLFAALEIFRRDPTRKDDLPTRRVLQWSLVAGLLMLVIPLLVVQPWAGYLFGSVWLGMIFAIDPMNYWLGKRCLWREWLNRDRQGIYSMLSAGLFCGFLWEFWNYWAVARWAYVFPIMQNMKVFEMPLLGFLGFPAFCIECFVMYELVDVKAFRKS